MRPSPVTGTPALNDGRFDVILVPTKGLVRAFAREQHLVTTRTCRRRVAVMAIDGNAPQRHLEHSGHVRKIIPQIEDNGWFFDTELLVLAEKQGFKIKDVPVRWIDDDDSRVKIVSTAWEDIKGVMRLRRFLWSESYSAVKTAPSTAS